MTRTLDTAVTLISDRDGSHRALPVIQHRRYDSPHRTWRSAPETERFGLNTAYSSLTIPFPNKQAGQVAPPL